jgi:hypothetical protein
MGVLRCVDGTVLTVLAVACSDRAGTPYEVTLDLRRGRTPFASVGERCGFRLSQLAASVTAARQDPEQVRAWPDPDDRFPEPGPAPESCLFPEPGPPPEPRLSREPWAASMEVFRPGEREFFSLRSREPGDLPGSGELRCVLRDSAQWLAGRGAGAPGQAGGWRLSRRALIEAWGADGIGLRAVLTSAELVTFLDTVLKEPVGGKACARAPAGAHAAGNKLAGTRRRVPDGSARSRLPALRT